MGFSGCTMRMAQYYKQNRLQQLRGFCYAVQTGSISKAAEKLYLRQPSVSLQIQALEREMRRKAVRTPGSANSVDPRRDALVRAGRPSH